jgi:hypothetical protein
MAAIKHSHDWEPLRAVGFDEEARIHQAHNVLPRRARERGRKKRLVKENMGRSV